MNAEPLVLATACSKDIQGALDRVCEGDTTIAIFETDGDMPKAVMLPWEAFVQIAAVATHSIIQNLPREGEGDEPSSTDA